MLHGTPPPPAVLQLLLQECLDEYKVVHIEHVFLPHKHVVTLPHLLHELLKRRGIRHVQPIPRGMTRNDRCGRRECQSFNHHLFVHHLLVIPRLVCGQVLRILPSTPLRRGLLLALAPLLLLRRTSGRGKSTIRGRPTLFPVRLDRLLIHALRIVPRVAVGRDSLPPRLRHGRTTGRPLRGIRSFALRRVRRERRCRNSHRGIIVSVPGRHRRRDGIDFRQINLHALHERLERVVPAGGRTGHGRRGRPEVLELLPASRGFHVFVDEEVRVIGTGLHDFFVLASLAVEHLNALLAPERLARNVGWVKLYHSGIIKTEPSRGLPANATYVDERVVVTALGRTDVNDNAPQPVPVLWPCDPFSVRLCPEWIQIASLVTGETGNGKRSEVKLVWEGTLVVDLHVVHQMVVELHAFEVEQEHSRGRKHSAALLRIHFLLALVTKVGVVPRQELPLHEQLETFNDVLLVLNRDSHGVERLLPLGRVRAVEAQQLMPKEAAKFLPQEALLPRGLQARLQPIEEHVEELVGVPLHPRIEGLVVIPRDRD
mmetsp:Transcript_33352/g.93582  ORF Transcript_33352/g.93582 Transcript_33352/m.93582 type:complete len:542 (-) Transcript_33352:826-2451(-)